MFKILLINLLNKTLIRKGFKNMQVVNLSRDFQTAFVLHDNGIQGTIRSEIIL